MFSQYKQISPNNPLLRAAAAYAGSSLYNSLLPTGTPESAELDAGAMALMAGVVPFKTGLRGAIGAGALAGYNALLPGPDLSPVYGAIAGLAAPSLYRAWRSESPFAESLEQEGRRIWDQQTARGQGFLDEILAAVDARMSKPTNKSASPAAVAQEVLNNAVEAVAASDKPSNFSQAIKRKAKTSVFATPVRRTKQTPSPPESSSSLGKTYLSSILRNSSPPTTQTTPVVQSVPSAQDVAKATLESVMPQTKQSPPSVQDMATAFEPPKVPASNPSNPSSSGLTVYRSNTNPSTQIKKKVQGKKL
jgi:hypothetical protein